MVCLTSSVLASRLVRQSVESLTIHSSLVATGEVTALSSYWNGQHNQIYTDVTIDLDTFMRGSYGQPSIVMTQLGGVVGDTAMTIIGYPAFAENERVLVFLKPRPGTTDRIMVTGLAQGKFHLETDPVTGETTAENEYEGRIPLAAIQTRIETLMER
jgi:hypothetical protein